MAEIVRNNSSSRRIRKGRVVIKGFAPDGAELYITRGDGFEIRGGSPETHAKMLDAAKTIMAVLDESGYELEHLTRREYMEIARIVQQLQDGTFQPGAELPPLLDLPE